MVIHGCKRYPCPRCHKEVIENPKLKAEIAELNEIIDALVDALGPAGDEVYEMVVEQVQGS